MRTELSAKGVVSREVAKRVIRSLAGEDRHGDVLMSGELLERTVFVLGDGPATNQWVRVRTGDRGADGKARDVMTFKAYSSGSDSLVQIVDVEIDGYDEAVEFLSEIGLKKASVQETRRTKIACNGPAGVRYMVTLDTWPWLDDEVFVSVTPTDGISDVLLSEFWQGLGLSDSDRRTPGVDRLYEDRFGMAATEIPIVRFGAPPPADPGSPHADERSARL